MTGRIGLWTSCSQVSNITPENPMGLGKGLATAGPNAVAREEWEPPLSAASKTLGYVPSFMTWMDKGQAFAPSSGIAGKGDPVPLPAGIMAVDSYASLIASGTGKPWEYATAYRYIKRFCDKLFVYHGSPTVCLSGNLAWLSPIFESDAIPVFDAEGDQTSLAMLEIAEQCAVRGREFAVEPFVSKQTLWFARKTPCFVLLQTVRDTIRKNWAPATGAAREYPHTNVMIGDPKQIDEDEVNGYLDRGWNVFLPLDTDPAVLAQFAADAPPPPPPPPDGPTTN